MRFWDILQCAGDRLGVATGRFGPTVATGGLNTVLQLGLNFGRDNRPDFGRHGPDIANIG